MATSKQLTISRLASGGLIANYYCSSRCRHCLYGCSPEWSKEYITPRNAISILNKIREMGCNSIHIGGGEPFLNFPALKKIIKCSTDTGVGIDYIETNSSWYANSGSAKEKLGQLLDLGVPALLVSISPFHNEYIPFEKVKGVIEACKDAGIAIIPWDEGFWSDLGALTPQRPHPFSDYEEKFGSHYLKDVLNRYWIHPGGRALNTFASILPQIPLDAILASSAGCEDLADSSHFHIDFEGRYIPGLCSGLAIEFDALGSPLDQKNYPIINMLYTEGVNKFFLWAKTNHNFKPAAIYTSKCHLCTDIRKHLVNKCKVNSRELAPKTFYEQI